MKVIFLIDSTTEDGTVIPESQAVVVAPEKLQLRQQAPGLAILGIEVGENQFRPFINYPVDLSVVTPEPPVIEAPKVEAKPRAKKAANSSKKKGR